MYVSIEGIPEIGKKAIVKQLPYHANVIVPHQEQDDEIENLYSEDEKIVQLYILKKSEKYYRELFDHIPTEKQDKIIVTNRSILTSIPFIRSHKKWSPFSSKILEEIADEIIARNGDLIPDLVIYLDSDTEKNKSIAFELIRYFCAKPQDCDFAILKFTNMHEAVREIVNIIEEKLKAVTTTK